jgi:hypothetical protein
MGNDSRAHDPCISVRVPFPWALVFTGSAVHNPTIWKVLEIFPKILGWKFVFGHGTPPWADFQKPYRRIEPAVLRSDCSFWNHCRAVVGVLIQPTR